MKKKSFVKKRIKNIVHIHNSKKNNLMNIASATFILLTVLLIFQITNVPTQIASLLPNTPAELFIKYPQIAAASGEIGITILSEIPEVITNMSSETWHNSDFPVTLRVTSKFPIVSVEYQLFPSGQTGSQHLSGKTFLSTVESISDQTTAVRSVWVSNVSIREVPDGNYTLRFNATSDRKVSNDQVVIQKNIDRVLPIILHESVARLNDSLIIEPTVQGNHFFVLSLNATDDLSGVLKGIAVVKTSRGNSIAELPLLPHRGDYIGYLDSSRFLSRSYIVEMRAIDRAGNVQRSAIAQSLTIRHNVSETKTHTSLLLPQHVPVAFSVPKNFSLIIVTGSTLENVTIEVRTYENDKNQSPTGKTTIGKGIQVLLDNATRDALRSAIIKLDYTDEELLASGLSESTLAFYKWNESTSSWMALLTTGVNTTANFIWANVSGFSTYGAFGTNSSEQNSPSTDSVSSTDSASSGGGSGGGGSSSLNQQKSNTSVVLNTITTTEATSNQSVIEAKSDQRDVEFVAVQESPKTTSCGGICFFTWKNIFIVSGTFFGVMLATFLYLVMRQNRTAHHR